MSRSWDVFCRVVDNFGDAAVCWRLAKQLAAEHGGKVRIWIDGLDALHALCPEVARDTTAQWIQGVEICHWSADAEFGVPAEIAVDAFGGGLPDAYLAAMMQRSPRPLWIILEYLSAEPWVDTHHGAPSPHPRLPLERYFFFPGLVPGTGGVLKEASLEARRDAFQSDSSRQAAFWRGLGYAPPAREAIVASLFGYENPVAASLLQAWADGGREVIAVVPRSLLRPQVGAFFGESQAADGATLRRGSLEARFVPFVPQPRYDELLWACDWNFVRGEDSFVRAQWAARPLVWHIYPQEERAHWIKLDAFLDRYCAGLESGPAKALRTLWQGWNAQEAPVTTQMRTAWDAVADCRDRLRLNARSWAAQLALPGDLAGNLAQFCEERL
ncbi:MAG: elongation factor P maturation arginine rhamnosyltransferase EarP [Betaproteobacteria bacterium]|nr:elongation factor P maturation arginine rhamnosyltransferase EarP [Betaproteobacteria bacterium]